MRLFSNYDEAFLMTQWDEMYRDLCASYRHFRLDATQIHAAQLQQHKKTYIRLLTKSLAERSYWPGPAHLYALYLKKWRYLYAINLTDRFMQVLWAKRLNTYLENTLSPNCYAYRKGKSYHDAVQQCAAFIRQQHQESKLDLYVLRSDIHQYSDSIPVHAASPLWPCLEQLLRRHQGDIDPYDWSILVALLRPEVRLTHGAMCHNLIGTPTGTPLACVINNLYLQPLDQYLDAIPGGCYCRYGDDFVFMHPDPERMIEVNHAIDRLLAPLGLQRGQDKDRWHYLTRAGRPCTVPSLKERCRGSQAFCFLGFALTARGTIALNTAKQRQLLRYCRQKLRAAKACMNQQSLADTALGLCRLLNAQWANLLDRDMGTPKSSYSAITSLTNCTDRVFLKNLDRELALIVAEVATDLRGSAALAILSYHHLRQRFGLHSLCQLKNLGKL